MLQPFVISILPKKMAYNELGSKCKNDSILKNIVEKILLFFIIAIITENIIINPPIDKAVLIPSSSAFFKAEPKLFSIGF